MAMPLIEPGAVIDGFKIGERVHSGGMATLWSVTRPDIDMPHVDEVAALGHKRPLTLRHRKIALSLLNLSTRRQSSD